MMSMYTPGQSVQALYSRLCLIHTTYGYNDLRLEWSYA